MSLGDQSQQWYPTSVQVTVLQARNLRIKGKNGTNDAYAIIQVAKDKFSTSVAEKCVAPVWKEEATFDLPMFQSGNADRCTLYITIMHRALVGLDKLLGQAIINLLDLHDTKSRKRTDWYKLVDKNGKEDKERGEVFLDIQFMRNNMTASMFDLSMQDKPRSRLSKLKDKVRGKKRDGLSDSASAVVPSTVSQVLTDSEEEKEVTTGSPKSKPSSKLKSLFTPKSNLHRGVSQSMSTLGTLPEKNGSLSSSRSSGLNVESPDVKRKFKFLGHKRTSSTDSKVSLGPFSLLNRSKQNIPEQNNLCINGSHVYAEEQEPKANSGSTLSLSGSIKGSVEDLRKSHERNMSDVSADSFKGLSIPTYKPEPMERTPRVSQLPITDEEKKHKREDGRLQELLDRQEEQDRRRQQEREERLRRQEEEERKKMLEDQEKKRQQEEEQQRKRGEEEQRRAEEQKRHEEARMTERLSSLFGLGKKKDEPSPPAMEHPRHAEVVASTNPFEDIPLSPDATNPFLEGSPADPPKGVQTTFAPSPPTNALPGRTAKVSAVKPRSALSPKSETDNTNPLGFPVTSDIQNTAPASNLPPKPSPSNEPFESFEPFDIFSNLHCSMAPPKPQRTENLSGGDYTTSMAQTKHKTPQPPSYPGGSSKNENHNPKNGSHSSNAQQGQRPPLPLPDYDVLFPKMMRHGVMTTTRWEHIIAEVNQRRMDGQVQFIGEEMSVDGPDEHNRSAVLKERNMPNLNQHQMDHEEESSHSTKSAEPKQALIPPKMSTLATARQLLDVNSKKAPLAKPLYATVNKSKQAHTNDHATVDKSDLFSAKALNTGPAPNFRNNKDPQEREKRPLSTDGQTTEPKVKPTPMARKKSNSSEDSNTDNSAPLPSAKRRQRAPNKEPVIQVQPEQATTLILTSSKSAQVERKNEVSFASKTLEENAGLERKKCNDLPTSVAKTVAIPKKQVPNVTSSLMKSDPFPNDKLISQDPWSVPLRNMDQDDLFADEPKQAKNLEDQFLTQKDFDNIFGSKNETDPFYNSATSKHEKDTFFGSAASKEETDPFFGSAATKDETDPFFGSAASKDETDPFFGSAASKDETDPFFASPASKDETDAFFGSSASKDETNPSKTHSNSSPSFQKVDSPMKKLAPQPPSSLEETIMKKKIKDKPASQSIQDDVELTVTSVAGPHNGESMMTKAVLAKDPFASPVQVSPSSATSELTSGSTFGGKSMLRAWVSPSEVQSVTSPSSTGGGVLTTRRPHPVKPMNTAENQPTSNISIVKDLKTPTIQEVTEKSKTTDSGPYTQLTQEELITLVVKQQVELSKKDSKILELEDYIDNLLVRVIEEKPSILLALDSKG